MKLVIKIFRNLIHYFENLYSWHKFYWNDRNWDYAYFVDIIIFKLEKMKDYFSSYTQRNNICCTSHHNLIVSRIELIINLLRKIYIEDYWMRLAHFNIEAKYGKTITHFKATNVKDFDGLYMNEFIIENEFVTDENREEYEKFYEIEINHAEMMTKKATKLVWNLISHNLTNFWD